MWVSASLYARLVALICAATLVCGCTLDDARSWFEPSRFRNGEGRIACPSGNRARFEPVLNTSRSATHRMLSRCWSGKFVLTYKGSIDDSFVVFLRNVESYGRADEIEERVLLLSSLEGEFEAAIAAGEILSRRRWHISVDEYRETYSFPDVFRHGYCAGACVFALAAAKTRNVSAVALLPLSSFPKKSGDRHITSAQLRNRIDDAKRYMISNGVSPGLVERMARLKNGQFEVIDWEELETYGLGDESAIREGALVFR
jgi:hypothetical protein